MAKSVGETYFKQNEKFMQLGMVLKNIFVLLFFATNESIPVVYIRNMQLSTAFCYGEDSSGFSVTQEKLARIH